MNEDKKITEYISKWKHVRLSTSSRARISRALREYTELHHSEVVRDVGVDRFTSNGTSNVSFFTKLFNYKPMAPIALALVLLLSAGGTVAASESARPGDFLFPIDQAIEHARLSLATDAEARARLQTQFAEERLEELRSLLAEFSVANTQPTTTSDTSASSTGATSSTTHTFEAEADVFTDTTIVKVEINDRKTTFETDADTRDEVIDVIVDRFDVDRATVEAALDFEIEDRASRIGERRSDTFSADGEERINLAVSLILDILDDDEIDDSDRERIRGGIATELHNDRVNIRTEDNQRIEIRNDDDDHRIEVRDGDNRIRIREKDGETRIDIKGSVSSFDDIFEDWRDDSDDRSSDDDDRQSHSNTHTFEAEADVFTDTTIVKVEINDRKTTFETDADTRDEVIDVIVDRFDVDRATVEAALDFEIEDRASRAKDGADDSNRSDDDSSDSDDRDEGIKKVEVRVEDGIAEVRMEYDGKRDEFEVVYTTKTALIASLALRSGLSEATIQSELDLEIKD